MPSCPVPEVLQLDALKMHQIDPSNAVSLKAMWTMFSKCSETIKEGHRYENMSWRVWSRESLCVTPVDSPPATSRVPSLSNSFSSDDSLHEKPLSSRSRSIGQDECASSLSKSRHLTSNTLEMIMVKIQEKSELCPLSPSIEASLPNLAKPACIPHVEPEADPRPLHDSTDSCLSNTTTATRSTTARQIEHRDSDTSVSSDGLIRSGSIVHGFSPAASSFRSRQQSTGVQPVPSSKLIPKNNPTIKAGMFTLGGSSEDDESSFEQRVLSHKAPPPKSSLSQSLSKTNLKTGSQSKMQMQPKRTSFKDVVAERRIQEDAENDEGAIESSDDEDDTDEVMESAIDEDEEEDGDDWEDSNSDDGKVVQEAHVFRRVDSRPDLVSRRSMLTLALNKSQTGLNHAYSQPALQRTRTGSTQAGHLGVSPDEDDGMMMQTSGRRPIQIPPPNPSGKSVAHSPRTTRRNMLSTELTESLRKNLLWERQQKSQTANAFLKRRNAQSMANLQSHTMPAAGPSQPPPPAALQETSKNNSWNHYFDNPWEYHTKGW
ncbi:hypothetical protein LTR99_005093 [Exophiala xenobiotica]|uniref:Nitrogen regulatory protein areA GATA-like domain-containing protein n=1 Tax=Vermiconidia calcicola TaxID=1690605 RepID=A0AAV9QFW5_9PEZI|nr:hypothetical protein LTR72_002953 [Exophiala xenobiotica]KAK5541426.1 hypothetical protein LTR25_003203 [Vermiconidia calcicola]KAK5270649.1 hypothetical protein LTR96_003927 [Exophiala xenobiotica]KAK5300713.1 hypothetical protein LTR14_001111 [Exophiala xenobiotica]KAK5303331.1 hypothetical protein LTR99_005093 [Exophiala xenobiotica]